MESGRGLIDLSAGGSGQRGDGCGSGSGKMTEGTVGNNNMGTKIFLGESTRTAFVEKHDYLLLEGYQYQRHQNADRYTSRSCNKNGRRADKPGTPRIR